MHTGVHSKFKDVFHFKESCLCNAETFSKQMQGPLMSFSLQHTFFVFACASRDAFILAHMVFMHSNLTSLLGVYSKIWILWHFMEILPQLPNSFCIYVVPLQWHISFQLNIFYVYTNILFSNPQNSLRILGTFSCCNNCVSMCNFLRSFKIDRHVMLWMQNDI